MQIHFTLNHKKIAAEIAPDTLLIDLVLSLIHISEPTRP